MTADPCLCGGGSPARLRLLWIWWAAASWIAVLTLAVFPFIKGMPAGLLPVALGAAAALAPHWLPARWTDKITAALYGSSDRAWLVGICIAAALVRIPVILFPSIPVFDQAKVLQYAKQLAGGLGYGDRLTFAPGQSAWLAIWIRMFGTNLHVLALVQSALAVATTGLIAWRLARYSKAGARWASLLTALSPSLVLWSGTLAYEATSVFLQVVLLIAFLYARDSASWRWLALGAASAIAAFVQPTFLAAPVLAACVLWFLGAAVRSSVWRGLLVFVALAAIVTPWTIRNYAKFHQLCLISANFGRVLLSSNHPASDGVDMDTSAIGSHLNDVAQDQLHLRMALQAMAQDPVLTAKRSAKRLAFMWGVDTSMLRSSVFGDPPRCGRGVYLVLSVLIQFVWSWFMVGWCIGATRGIRRFKHQPFEVWAVVFVGLTWTVHLLMEPFCRHHVPLVPLIALAALPEYWRWAARNAPEASVVDGRAPGLPS